MANIELPNNWAAQISFGVSDKTRTNFEALPEEKKPKKGQIVFLINDKTIYFEGQYFGLSATDSATLASVASDIAMLKQELEYGETNWDTLKNSQATLAAGLLSLKQSLDNQIGTTSIGENVTITAAIAALQQGVGSIVAGVSSVNSKSGDVTLYAGDISISNNDPTTIAAALDGKVLISTDDTPLKTNSQVSGSTLTTTASIATAIENAHAAAVGASTAAGNKIAKSATNTAVKASGATTSVTGIKPSDLEDGEDIAQAIEDTAVGLIGSNNSWESGESKTLGQLRTLIATLSTTVTGLDSAQSTRITNIINELINASGSGDDFVNTMIDKLLTLMAYSSTTDGSGNSVDGGGGYYNINTGVNNASTYANTIQGIIDALESYIDQKASDVAAAAAGGSVTSVKATGATVTGTDAGTGDGAKKGNVVITVSSDTVSLTSAITQSNGQGATVASGASIQTALQSINNAAANAQVSANTALSLLQWEVF